jgi:ferrochelatase
MTFGVLLMTFGSPVTLDDVPRYLSSVRGGRPVADELVAEFQRRYRRIGGSPLLAITQAQAAALEARLNEVGDGSDGARYRVAVGMRHAPPFIADALGDLAAAGARRIAAIILSPQYSPIIMGGYLRAVDAARALLPAGTEVAVAGAWHLEPAFLGALAQRVLEALAKLPRAGRERVPVILTAHSLPRSVVDREPEYVEQLFETVEAVARLAGLDGDEAPTSRSSLAGELPRGARWRFAYQSAGHTPEEWLKPDLKELLPGLQAAGYQDVLVVPVQFVADHLEILYDIDVAAREEAEEAGLTFHRIESLNCSPLFVDALASVARRTLGAADPGGQAQAAGAAQSATAVRVA